MVFLFPTAFTLRCCQTHTEGATKPGTGSPRVWDGSATVLQILFIQHGAQHAPMTSLHFEVHHVQLKIIFIKLIINYPYLGQYSRLLHLLYKHTYKKIIKTAHFYYGCFYWTCLFSWHHHENHPTSVTTISKKMCLLQKDHLSGCLGHVELTAVQKYLHHKWRCLRTPKTNKYQVKRNLAATGVPLMCIWEAQYYSMWISERANYTKLYSKSVKPDASSSSCQH